MKNIEYIAANTPARSQVITTFQLKRSVDISSIIMDERLNLWYYVTGGAGYEITHPELVIVIFKTKSDIYEMNIDYVSFKL